MNLWGVAKLVRHRNLDPTFKGSSPFTPEFFLGILFFNKV